MKINANWRVDGQINGQLQRQCKCTGGREASCNGRASCQLQRPCNIARLAERLSASCAPRDARIGIPDLTYGTSACIDTISIIFSLTFHWFYKLFLQPFIAKGGPLPHPQGGGRGATHTHRGGRGGTTHTHRGDGGVDLGIARCTACCKFQPANIARPSTCILHGR